MSKDEAEAMMDQVPGWQLADAGNRLTRTWKFGNFAKALAFVNKVGELAEEEGHHPDVTFGWGYATVEIWTHKIGGLHENDFILAAKSTPPTASGAGKQAGSLPQRAATPLW
ncbi:pterin-4-alpha-carbinolamine dehydratase [Alkalilimnicola ehrlichii]|nr:4a-hydroxytetrahydrobiopterin dehydratase [Alkalilimnicola ehrlichii]RFA28312.1 pterin-4-alpha-carbinolamine dehydratase [Alkalilimnicola ehrlichii]